MPAEVIRATPEEKEYAIASREAFQARNAERVAARPGGAQALGVVDGERVRRS